MATRLPWSSMIEKCVVSSCSRNGVGEFENRLLGVALSGLIVVRRPASA